jgi:hypothetical protein
LRTCPLPIAVHSKGGKQGSPAGIERITRVSWRGFGNEKNPTSLNALKMRSVPVGLFLYATSQKQKNPTSLNALKIALSAGGAFSL